jgi:DHA3 family macrolide efflux protein-like MFS transporter
MDQEPAGMRRFVLIWLGQVISMVGSGITAFAISIWVYQKTSSVTLFALTAFLKYLPGVLASPLAGWVADRRDRRTIMILADSGAAFSTLLVAWALWRGEPALWPIYVATAANALFDAFQSPAYAAALATWVPRERLVRASALVDLGGKMSALVAPPLAGFLLTSLGLAGILLLDVITCILAVITLLAVRLPAMERSVPTVQGEAADGKPLAGMLDSLRYVARRPGLRGLLVLTGVNLLLIAVNATLSIPILLAFTSSGVVGMLALLFGVSGLLGGAAIAAWGGPPRPIDGVLGAHLGVGLGLILFGLRPNLALMALAGVWLSFLLPIRDSLSAAIWRMRVPQRMQGRVFGLLQAVSASAFGLTYLALGPLADRVLEPLLVPGGLLATSVGRVIGVGSGRGLALCVVLAGLFTLVTTAIARQSPHVRGV